MEQMEDVFQTIIDQALEIMLSIDSDGNLIIINNSGIAELGIQDDITCHHITEFFPEYKTSSSADADSILVFDGLVRNMMVYRLNKTCFPALVKGFATGNSRFPFVVMIRSTLELYTVKKENEHAKNEASQADKVKNEFVANITHELRTPVNGIKGNTDILLEKETDPEKLQTLHTIKRGCDDMNNLINTILDFSKLESGKFTLEQRKFKFKDLIDYIKSTHLPKITEKGLDFFVTVSPEIPEYIIGDELRIGQILNNLLSNACKFTSVGKITLEVLRTNVVGNKMELFFLVIDTGIGIDKEGQEKLFKSFSQVDASVSRKYGGTGLGLNISKQLVGLMNGNISVESEKGKGTMFSFSIWVDIPEDEVVSSSHIDTVGNISDYLDGDESQKALLYGTAENAAELKGKLDKLILCLEMRNWEKAENFTNSIKELTAEAPKEIKTSALRLKMSVQKADYDKSIDAYNNLIEAMENTNG